MGSVFQTREYPGDLSREKVRDLFEADQDADCYENGHSYSGGIGMLTGVDFPDQGAPFGSIEEARQWIDDNCRKWGPALAVKSYDPVNGPKWVIGGSCAS